MSVFIEKGTKCDWCGKEATAQTGVVIFNNRKQRAGFTCEDCPGKNGNPVFEDETAWEFWKKKHPILSKRIMNGGGPKYQYSKTAGGEAWDEP
jgi:hypothetical protein